MARLFLARYSSKLSSGPGGETVKGALSANRPTGANAARRNVDVRILIGAQDWAQLVCFSNRLAEAVKEGEESACE